MENDKTKNPVQSLENCQDSSMKENILAKAPVMIPEGRGLTFDAEATVCPGCVTRDQKSHCRYCVESFPLLVTHDHADKAGNMEDPVPSAPAIGPMVKKTPVDNSILVFGGKPLPSLGITSLGDTPGDNQQQNGKDKTKQGCEQEVIHVYIRNKKRLLG